MFVHKFMWREFILFELYTESVPGDELSSSIYSQNVSFFHDSKIRCGWSLNWCSWIFLDLWNKIRPHCYCCVRLLRLLSPLAPSRRGDLQILGFCLLHWLCGTLPWDSVLKNPTEVQEAKTRLVDYQTQGRSRMWSSYSRFGFWLILRQHPEDGLF